MMRMMGEAPDDIKESSISVVIRLLLQFMLHGRKINPFFVCHGILVPYLQVYTTPS